MVHSRYFQALHTYCSHNNAMKITSSQHTLHITTWKSAAPQSHECKKHDIRGTSCVISGFRREIAENCALLGYYAASSDNLLPTFRDNLSVPSNQILFDALGFL